MLLHCWPDSPGHCQHAPDKPFSMISATLYALRSNIFCKVTKFTIYLHTFAADNLPPNYIIKVQIKEFHLKYYFRSVEIENVFRTSLRESFTVTTSLLDGWVGTEEQVHHSHSHVWSRVMVTTDSWSLLTTSLYHLIFQCWAQEELPDTHRIPNNAGLREEEFSEACIKQSKRSISPVTVSILPLLKIGSENCGFQEDSNMKTFCVNIFLHLCNDPDTENLELWWIVDRWLCLNNIWINML